jgi:hypothetical protein
MIFCRAIFHGEIKSSVGWMEILAWTAEMAVWDQAKKITVFGFENWGIGSQIILWKLWHYTSTLLDF